MWGAVARRIAARRSHCTRVRRGCGCCGSCRIITVIGISVDQKKKTVGYTKFGFYSPTKLSLFFQNIGLTLTLDDFRETYFVHFHPSDFLNAAHTEMSVTRRKTRRRCVSDLVVNWLNFDAAFCAWPLSKCRKPKCSR